MKTRLLIIALLMVAGIINAQDTIRTLVISEVRLDDARESYIEISNVGTTTLNLSDFQVGTAGPWSTPKVIGDLSRSWNISANYALRLPDQELAPGECFVIGGLYDWNPEAWARGVPNTTRVMNKKEFWEISDIQAHFPEAPTTDATDSVNNWYHLLDTWNGRECVFIAQYFFDGDNNISDSVVVDQVNGYEFDSDGTRDEGPADVAGVTDATGTTTLVRRFNVKSGTIDFLSSAGISYEDSEWMPIPRQLGGWEQVRSLFFTAGNHGDYNLDESTLSSSTVDINWEDTILTVPWGVRRDDSLMFQFDKKPGIAWHFDYAKTSADSAFYSLRTGDRMTIYACGNDLDVMNFKIEVTPPTNGANIVVPKKMADSHGYYSIYPPTWVITDKIPGMDTIKEISFGTRTDTLLKYIEKAPEASWEFEFVGGAVRPDLMAGDILKVTAKNGDIKKYYIKPDKFVKSHNAYLSSITFPDIPEDYKGFYGWVGDTIPEFLSSKSDFRVKVPFEVEGIPALVAKTEDVNAKVEIERAKNLTGSVSDRTVTYTVTAPDDTTIRDYRVKLEREKDFDHTQQWPQGEPFISQFVWKQDYSNSFVEIINPTPGPLDLSNYMITFGYNGTAADAIRNHAGTTEWADRYLKYIPGYKWQDQTNWEIQPAIAESDINIDPMVKAGDVFVIAEVWTSSNADTYPAFVIDQIDIDYNHNPWGEDLKDNLINSWWGAKIFLFKIENDSVKNGTKPATDPNDFELIDVFGNTADRWNVGGVSADQCYAYTRKPEVYNGNPEIGGSFGTTEEDSEWTMINEARLSANGAGWPALRVLVADGIGTHFMDDVTLYKSTVSSAVYKVSDGYSLDETIMGVVAGTDVSEFLSNLYKADEEQKLYVISGTDTLEASDNISQDDILSVISADGLNNTVYLLDQAELSDDAVLTSSAYTVDISGSTGTITGFDYTETLRDVVDNVDLPFGASLNVIDENNAYVPLLILNYDTLLVDVHVNADTYFEVVAENGTTKIVYHLVPDLMNSGAFVTSNVFNVDQMASLISDIPDGAAIYGILKYLIPAPGASVKVVDKLGFDRGEGYIYMDDRIVVTSEDGETTKIYYLKVLSQKISYLAYVLSDVYTVDQLEFAITGNISVLVSINDFLANLTPAEDATLMVTNSAGVEQTGNLGDGDVLVVTAGDGVTKVTYSLGIGNGVSTTNSLAVKVYPNPSSGLVNVSGLETGNRISVSNMLGQTMIDKVVTNNTEVINLKGQSSGLYFVTVKNAGQVVGRYKLVLK